MADNITTSMQHLSFDDCAKHVIGIAAAQQKATFQLVAGLAVAMIAGAYPGPVKQADGSYVTPKAVGYDETITKLKADLVPTGLKQAMIYRYIALSKSLCLKLVTTEGKFGGAIGHVLTAKNAKAAVETIYNHIVSKVTDKGTLDDLRLYVTKAPANDTGEAKQEGVKASTSSAESITARLVKEPTILSGMKPEVLLGAIGQGDETRVQFLDKAIDSLATPEALHHVMQHAKARLEAMAKGAKVDKTARTGKDGKRTGVKVDKEIRELAGAAA